MYGADMYESNEPIMVVYIVLFFSREILTGAVLKYVLAQITIFPRSDGCLRCQVTRLIVNKHLLQNSVGEQPINIMAPWCIIQITNEVSLINA